MCIIALQICRYALLCCDVLTGKIRSAMGLTWWLRTLA